MRLGWQGSLLDITPVGMYSVYKGVSYSLLSDYVGLVEFESS